MCPFLALSGAIRTESTEVIFTNLLTHVFLGAVRPEGAEALFVVGAEWDLAVGVNVEVETLFAIGAIAVPHEKVAFWHFAPNESVVSAQQST